MAQCQHYVDIVKKIDIIKSINNYLYLTILVLDADKTVNSFDSPLRIACFNGHHEDVNTILSSCPAKEDKQKMLDAMDYSNGYTPLHIACEQEHTEVVKVLIKHGANPVICSHNDTLYQRLTKRSGDIEINLDDKFRATYYKNAEDIVQSLLDDEVSVPYFLECIDQSNEICYSMSSRFFVGFTPLHVAAKNGSVKIFSVLLKKFPKSNDLTPSQIECDINCTDTYKVRIMVIIITIIIIIIIII